MSRALNKDHTDSVPKHKQCQSQRSNRFADVEFSHYTLFRSRVDGGTDVDGNGEKANQASDEELFAE